MNAKKIMLLVFEFLFVGGFLAFIWHLAGVEFSLGRVVFGAVFGMLGFRGIKYAIQKMRSKTIRH